MATPTSFLLECTQQWPITPTPGMCADFHQSAIELTKGHHNGNTKYRIAWMYGGAGYGGTVAGNGVNGAFGAYSDIWWVPIYFIRSIISMVNRCISTML
jgi:hypothetical protein